ncbi:hypothetical protein AB6A40_009307 [Gnathostoma spinigerum]|uniref:Uncharacterized protein n=1 Tax=Gnathostoma spinigerum TaxID=75299 RepID=A0ABD6ERN0_9BILA
MLRSLKYYFWSIQRLSYEISFACPVRVSIDGSCSRFVVIRGTKAHIRLVVDNVMPKSIPKFSATAIFKMVSADWMKTKRTAGHQPQFECAFHEVDGVNKFGCILKGEPICVDRNSEDPVLSAGVLDSDSETLTFHTDQSVTGDTDLVPGRTILTLVANADRVGVFAVDRIEISVLDSLDIVYAWQDLPEVEKDVGSRSLCFVHTKSAVVRLKPIKGRFLLAGITQVIYLEISPGSESHSPDAMKEISTLQIKALGRNGDVEFLNENESAWSTEYEKSIEILGPSENRLIPVYLCRCLRRNARKITDEEGNEDVADDLEQLLVKWNRSEWIFTLGFRPLMSMKIASSLLEEKYVQFSEYCSFDFQK